MSSATDTGYIRLETELDRTCPPSPIPDSRDEGQPIPVASTEDMMVESPSQTLRDVDGELVDPPSVNLEMNPMKATPKQGVREKATAAKSTVVPLEDTEASNPFSNEYPLSRQVFDLEKRAQEFQDSCEFWKKKCEELTSTLELVNEAMKKERSDNKTKHKSLESANNAVFQQLEEEKKKAKELQAKNESLAADLFAVSREKTMLGKILEEKTHESWIFRCATAVIFKLIPSVGERVSMRNLLHSVLVGLQRKLQRERAAREEAEAQNRNNSHQVSEQGVEPLPQQQERLLISGTGELDSNLKDLPPQDENSLQKSQKRPRETEEEETGAPDDDSDDDSDDDQPLMQVLKNKAKKLKMIPCRRKSASDV